MTSKPKLKCHKLNKSNSKKIPWSMMNLDLLFLFQKYLLSIQLYDAHVKKYDMDYVTKMVIKAHSLHDLMIE